MPLACALATEYRVLIPDLPGYGKSAKPPRPLNVREHADALACWIRVAGIAPVACLGNSFGCQVLAEMTVRHPDVVSRLILLGPTVDSHAHVLARQAWRLGRDFLHERKTLPIVLMHDLADMGPTTAVGSIRAMMDHRMERALPHVSVPTLIVRGTRDPIAPQRWAEEAAALAPQGDLVTIAGAPHAANYSAPDDVAVIVRRYVPKQASPAS